MLFGGYRRVMVDGVLLLYKNMKSTCVCVCVCVLCVI